MVGTMIKAPFPNACDICDAYEWKLGVSRAAAGELAVGQPLAPAESSGSGLNPSPARVTYTNGERLVATTGHRPDGVRPRAAVRAQRVFGWMEGARRRWDHAIPSL